MSAPRARAVRRGLASAVWLVFLAGCDEKPLIDIAPQELMQAIVQENRDTVAQWVFAGVDLNQPRPFAHPFFPDGKAHDVTPLMAAIMIRDPRTVAVLLRGGTDPNLRSEFAHPELGSSPVAASTPLAAAVVTREEDIVRQLLAAGATVHGSAGGEALTAAILTGRPPLITQLLDAGVDANQPMRFSHPDLFDGKQVEILPLVAAVAATGEPAIIDALAKGGAVTRTENGTKALCTAAIYNKANAAAALVKLGAPVNAACDDGRFPLDVAKEGGHSEVAQVLAAASGES